MSANMLTRYCQLTVKQREFLDKIIDRLGISARAYSRILKLSRTISDLAGEKNITQEAIAEALQYRNLDRFER